MNILIFMVLLILFVLLPVLEIAILIKIGGLVGIWGTLGFLLTTALIGGFLIKRHGLRTILDAGNALDRRSSALDEVFRGVCFVLAGILLLTPGLLTDLVGLLFLIRPIRQLVRHRLSRHFTHFSFGPAHDSAEPLDTDATIEGNFNEIDAKDQS